MKPLIFISILLTTIFSQADSFTIIRDGNEYLCEQHTTPDPGGQLACRDAAYRGPFSHEESEQLCEGSFTQAPATCAVKAFTGPFSKEQSIQLCKSAKSNGPADCALKAFTGPFDIKQSIELCQRTGTIANAECALKAFAGPYSREEAIRICKSEPHLLLRSLDMMQASPEVMQKSQLFKNIQKILGI